MMIAPEPPSGRSGRGKKRRGRRPAANGSSGPKSQPRQQRQQRKTSPAARNNPGGIYTAPMDHSYRDNGADQNGRGRGRNGFDAEPIPKSDEIQSSIFAFVEDLFFSAKIQETARKLNVKVDFLKTDKELLDRVDDGSGERIALVIVDLNNNGTKPLPLIAKLKSKLKKGTSVVGFLSHVQGELKVKAQEAGCDMVLPRSAFSQNLPQLLRRHASADSLSNAGEDSSEAPPAHGSRSQQPNR